MGESSSKHLTVKTDTEHPVRKPSARPDSRSRLLFKSLSKGAAFVGILVGVLVLAGWWFDAVSLKGVFNNLVTMKPNTALCFILCGAALWLLHDAETLAASTWKKRVAQIMAVVVSLTGLLTLVEFIFGLNFGIDTLLFNAATTAEAIKFPGRMSAATACNFLFLGVALLSLSEERRKGLLRLSQWFAILPAIVSIVAFIGYAYDVESFYKVYPLTSIALHSTLTFFVVALGILLARGFHGLTAIFAARGAGGLLARRLVPLALVLPFVLGWLRLRGEESGYYGAKFGLAIFATSNILIFILLIWRTANTLDRLERERKFAETNSARLASIVESSADAIISKTFDGTILSWNRGAENLFGYTEREAVGRNIRILFPPELLGEEETIVGKIKRGAHISHYETVRLRKDGSEIFVSLTVSPIVDADENIVAISKTARDITERKRREASLAFLADLTKQMISLSTPSEIVQSFGKQAGAFLGASVCAFVDINETKDLAVIFDEWRREGGLSLVGRYNLTEYVTDEYRAQMSRGQAVVVRDVTRDARIQDKEKFAALNIGALINIPLIRHGEWRFSLGVYHDRAYNWRDDEIDLMLEAAVRIWNKLERARAEEIVLRMNETLEQRVAERTAQLAAANKELESFSYSVSHDLRAPLRHIGGFADMLNKRAAARLDERSRHYLRTIKESSRHAGQLVDDLLSFSRMGRVEMRRALLDLNTLVAEVRRDLRPDTENRRIIWKVAGMPRAQGDPSMLRQVLQNLLANAVKYTRTRPEAVIEIGSEDGEREFVYYVRDNGVGFDMQYVDKLFGVFQRLHRADEFEGTGIGLANVQRIIARHGGRVWAEGALDAGATFYFTLPKTSKEEIDDGTQADTDG